MPTDSPSGRPAGDRAVGRRVLEVEAAALAALAEALGDSFERAVEQLASVAGRVIVSGMGKSGHIGRKIAATLASTGTPALFVHPGEASHGDLGMITAEDAVLALSNSGNTAELGDIVTYTRRFRIPLISITGPGLGMLGERADVALVLPEAPEACPMGLAPTTSTTMMLGLGDALAVALIERRGFSAADFGVFHPGGALGRRLITVREIMHADDDLPLVTSETPMAEAILAMTRGRFGCAGILSEGKLAGVITDGDLRRHMAGDLLARPAGEIMTAAPRTIAPNALAVEALRRMNRYKITSLFVVEDDRPLGIVHIHDCLRAGVA